MVRALPEKKAHSDKEKGTEPRNSKNKVKKNPGNTDSPSARKKYFKELPGGILPKNGNPMPDDANKNDEVRVLLDHEKRLQRNNDRELTLNYRPYPERRTHGITSPPNVPPTRGGVSDADSPYGNYPRGVWGGMVLFSVFMTFLVSWSPGMTLTWVAILTVFLLSLTECRTQARDFSMQTLTHVVTFAYHKVTSVNPSDIPGGGGDMGMILHLRNA
jgi:hypothetical protein